MKKYILLAAGLTLVSPVIFAQRPPIEVKASVTRHGPEKGSLLIIGGNVGSTAAIWNKFTELAGGKDKAKIVVITAALTSICSNATGNSTWST